MNDGDRVTAFRTIRSSIAVDIACTLFSLVIATVMTLVIGAFSAPAPAALLFLTGACAYLYWYIYFPIRNSEPAPADWEPLQSVTAPNIEVRLSERLDSRAIDLLFRKIVIINPAQRRATESLIAHEVAHIRHGDSVMFHIFAVLAIYNCLAAVLIAVFAIGVAVESVFFEVALTQTLGNWILPGLAVTAIGALLYSFTLISRSLHDREFNADAASHQLLGEAYIRFLERAARRSALKPIEKASVIEALQSAWRRLLAYACHPKTAKRIEALRHRQNFQASRSVKNVFFSVSFMFLTLYIFVATSTLFEKVFGGGLFDFEAPQHWSIIGLLLVASFSGAAMASMFAREAALQRTGAGLSFRFVFWFGLFFFLYINVPNALHLASAWLSDSVELDPKKYDLEDGALSLVVGLVVGAAMILLNRVMYHVLPRHNSYVMHLFIGAGSTLAGFLAVKYAVALVQALMR